MKKALSTEHENPQPARSTVS